MILSLPFSYFHVLVPPFGIPRLRKHIRCIKLFPQFLSLQKIKIRLSARNFPVNHFLHTKSSLRILQNAGHFFAAGNGPAGASTCLSNISLSLNHLLQGRQELSIALIFLSLTRISTIPLSMEFILQLFVSPPHVQRRQNIAIPLRAWLVDDDVIEVFEGDRG